LSGTDWSTFNGKIGGTFASGQVAFGTGVNTVGGDSGLTWDNVNKNLSIVNGRLFVSKGTSNVFIGDSATGSAITTGNSNVGLGLSSLSKVTTGVSNLGLGTNALRENVTTSNNTSIGSASLLNLILGGSNIAIGTNAGRYITGLVTSLTNSTTSIFIGINSAAQSDGQSNQIVIGATALGLGSNTIVLGNSSHTLTRLFGSVGIGVDAPTNTLDVNGTARIRTISNLGSTATRFLVASATGVVSERTGSELASDLGISGGSNWTVGTGFIYRNGPVVIGDTVWSNSTALTVKGNATASSWVLKVQDSGGSNLIALLNDRRLWMYSDIINLGNNPSGVNGVTIKAFTSGAVNAFSVQDSSSNVLFSLNANGQFFFRSDRMQLGLPSSPPTNGITIKIPSTGFVNAFLVQDSTNANNLQFFANGTVASLASRHGFGIVSGIITNGSHFKGSSSSTDDIFVIENSSSQRAFEVRGNRQIAMAGLPTSSAGLGANDLWNDGGNVVIGTTQTFRDESTAKTTASADQTLPSGVLTILDYDTTVVNNNTSIYTVGTTGRITVNSTGIYTITAGVVVEADAITALESAFLGIFRNGDLVSISSINTTIAAGAQSGLSTSTILSLTSGDIIDCRALVNSVGGVANGLARRLGTLLGANATQVNSLSITKSSQ
jgi:hypothetical protein